MSFRVLVVPEDPTHNGAILQPLVARVLAECGRPQADVKVLTEPRVQGYDHARSVLDDVVAKYGWYDLILFCPDRDGQERREVELRDLEGRIRRSAMQQRPGGRSLFLCCAAIEEVETWLLAGHIDRLSRSWRDVRADTSVKETEFGAFLRNHGEPGAPDGGRKALMREGLQNYPGIRTRCPELADLEARIRAAIEGA